MWEIHAAYGVSAHYFVDYYGFIRCPLLLLLAFWLSQLMNCLLIVLWAAMTLGPLPCPLPMSKALVSLIWVTVWSRILGSHAHVLLLSDCALKLHIHITLLQFRCCIYYLYCPASIHMLPWLSILPCLHLYAAMTTWCVHVWPVHDPDYLCTLLTWPICMWSVH